MTGPEGMMTNRDKRREARKQQYRQTQSQRKQVRKQQIRRQQMQRGTLIGGGVLILVLLGILVVFTTMHGATPTPKPIDGLACTSTSGSATHLDTYVELYSNNQQQTVPTGIGIQANCSYPLTVQPGQQNVITARASSANTTYTLGQFFAIWGKPLSTTQAGQYQAASGAKVTFEVWDGKGNFQIYMGDPTKIQLQNHETIAILVNSPNAKPLPYSDWGKVTK